MIELIFLFGEMLELIASDIIILGIEMQVIVPIVLLIWIISCLLFTKYFKIF